MTFNKKKCTVFFYAAILATLLFNPNSAAAETSTIKLDSNVNSHSIGLFSDILEDRDKSLTIEDVAASDNQHRFMPLRKEIPNFGITQSAYWFRTYISNPYPTEQKIILEEPIPYIDSIMLFVPDANSAGGYSVRHVGDRKPFRERENNHHLFLFNLTLQPGETLPIYIRVESRAALITPFTLWQADAYAEHAQNSAFSFGLFFGILLIFAIYSTYLYFYLKDKNYLFFILFIGSIALMVSTSQGLSYKYLWPESTWLAERMQVFSIAFIQLCGTLYARNFLSTRHNLPRIDKVLRLFLGGISIVILLTFIIEEVVSLAIISFASVQLYSPLLLISGIVSWRKGNKAARFYLMAWSSSIVGSIISSLTLFGLLPYHFYLLHAVSIGFLVDVVLLSLALADRIYVLRNERDRAKQLAHDALQEAKNSLEEEVARRTSDLEKAKREADFANQAKTQFLSNMSHELRTPLNGILGFAELLLTDAEAPLTPTQTRNANIIHDSGKHLNALIDDILNISMIETGRITINLETTSFSQILDQSLIVISTMARKRRVQIHNTTDKTKPYWVSADPLRLRQIVINLISNAIKYSPEGGLVTVTVENHDGKIRFSVKDCGPGIAKEDLCIIFEPFTRLETMKNEVDGIGIGLTITRKLVDLMNGRIYIESIVGEGSTFCIELAEVLPSQLSPSTPKGAIANQGETAPPGEKAPPPGKTALILYVEDNKANQVYVEHIFKRRPDLNLICADKGEEGVALARQHQPDVILTDILLPDISGLEVLAQLKASQLTENTPVIAVSANATETDLKDGTAAGFVAYLTKPLGINELLETIDNLLIPIKPG